MKKIATIALFTIITASGLHSSDECYNWRINCPSVSQVKLPMTEESMKTHGSVIVEGPYNTTYSWTPKACVKTIHVVTDGYISMLDCKDTHPSTVAYLYNKIAHDEMVARQISPLAPLIRLGILPQHCR